MSDHTELLKQVVTLSEKNWDGSDSTEINVGGATVGQLYGNDDYPCLDPEEDDMAAIAADLKFFGNAVCQCLEMYKAMQEFCDRVDRGEVRSVKTYAKFKDILTRVNP